MNILSIQTDIIVGIQQINIPNFIEDDELREQLSFNELEKYHFSLNQFREALTNETG